MESDFDQQESAEVRETRTNSILNSAKDVVKHSSAQVHPQDHLQPLIENRNFAITSRNIDLLHQDSYAEMWIDRDKKERRIMFVILGTLLVFFVAGAILVYMRMLIKKIPIANNSTKTPQFARPSMKLLLNSTAIPQSPHTVAIVQGHRYVQFWRNYLYTLDTRQETWSSAEQKCAGWQGHLVSIADADEKIFVQGLQRNLHIWTGYSKVNRTGTDDFQWNDNSKSTFEDWASDGESNIDSDLHFGCVSQLPIGAGRNNITSGTWKIEPCDVKLPFLCKKLSPSTDFRRSY
uniref:C-type lectin domain-containing protein n=1 Tax=Plectus sambesii TaxID=2011161 RepID=A0A914UIC5_9BILA